MRIRNQHFRSVNKEDIKTFDDLAVIMEGCSKTFRDLLHKHFEYQQRVEDGIWSDVYLKVDTIASEADCNEKTVDRFNTDFAALVQKRNRYINGRQTSNVYKMTKTVYQYMKAFWRLGLWKQGNNFDFWWKWIKKIWVDCGCDHLTFMNKVWNHKSNSLKNKDGSYEHGSKKMSLGDLGKCPSSSNSLSQEMNICTGWVPSGDVKKAEDWLRKKIRDSINDVKWYVVDQKHHLISLKGLLGSCLKENLAR